jgi:hypothetical protein
MGIKCKERIAVFQYMAMTTVNAIKYTHPDSRYSF